MQITNKLNVFKSALLVVKYVIYIAFSSKMTDFYFSLSQKVEMTDVFA